jgi:hypothetical protein
MIAITDMIQRRFSRLVEDKGVRTVFQQKLETEKRINDHLSKEKQQRTL